ncbi:MAG: Trm112 family protein [Arsenophonus sp.]|nr:MAG: Trm112 family protein [Arsenophonus sp.]
MDAFLLKIVVCPICLGKLFYDSKNVEFICKNDHLAYPIRNNIPVLLKEEARKISLDE